MAKVKSQALWTFRYIDYIDYIEIMDFTMKHINLADYDYDLPEERIAQYPVSERDLSKLLIYKGKNISKDSFRNIVDHLPSNSLLVLNNTRVIRARILFRKPTGAVIEVFCLEPLLPFGYEFSLSSKEPVEWKCIIGNLKKWRRGTLSASFQFKNKQYNIIAEKIRNEGAAWRIRFTWNSCEISFGEVIEATGHIPLPPYINREDETADISRYQTVYSTTPGSVAAPTAGLHFTDHVLRKLKEKGIRSVEVTLHVGAGTFQPIKVRNIADHEMHLEHFFVTDNTISELIENHDRIIAVGTTSVRMLESLHWLGVKLLNRHNAPLTDLSLGQWEAYDFESVIPVQESLLAILDLMKKRKVSFLHASTGIMIIPGYKFRMINGIITNFHQPKSTLLLLVSAWTGENWKEIYNYAFDNGFRFLSYGDSSLLLR
jgi:S-adenosylmethionine:tRNA ribosyltransferase-isomerase